MPFTHIIKPTSLCNFNCSFCSAKLLDIPIHKKVPKILKEYLIANKANHVMISGGEPLINPKSYFEDLINILDYINGCNNYEIGITSNMVLWYENPEKWDWLFKNPHVIVETSFQYGGERKDSNEFTEDRFINIFNTFLERYKYKLEFIYVVNENNEKYVLKACELAKKLGTKLSISAQQPIGISNSFYSKPQILELYMKIIDNGYENIVSNIKWIYDRCCPFVNDINKCLNNTEAVYVDKNGKLIKHICDNTISANVPINSNESVLFPKCYGCKLLRLCNGCPIDTHYTKPIKEEHCKWMHKNIDKLKKYNFIDKNGNY